MFSRLQARAEDADSLLCVGLDPHPEFAASAAEAEEFCIGMIEATAAAAAAFKPNIAFFETFGGAGWEALQRVIATVPADTPVIVDAKRGDIGSTASAYADAIFDGLGADAVTLSPYLGPRSIEPFLRPGKAIFVLVRTSGPDSGLIQDIPLADGRPFFEHVVSTISGPNVGYVVGATAPGPLAAVRRLAPDAWILAPGVGAQGADLAAAVSAAKRPDGGGVLLPVSRALARADDPAAAAEEIRAAINAAAPAAATDPRDDLAMALFDTGCVRFGSFKLKSGVASPFYLDLRRLTARPEVLRLVARELSALLSALRFDHVAALPYAALPIGTAIALQTGASLIYPRREVKHYGTRAVVEGVFAQGDTAVVVDDLATSGASKIEAIQRLAAVGLVVTDIVVLVDRQGGAAEVLGRAGYRLHAVITVRDLVDRLRRLGAISSAEHEAVVGYLDG